MLGYFDIHSHILPGIDDGAQSLTETVKMLHIAHKEGIRSIITTPHFHEGRFRISKKQIREALHKVEQAIKDENLDISLYLGNEIYYSQSSLELLIKKQIFTLAESNYVLVEFSPMAPFQYIKSGLQSFVLNGYWPILAHVERYKSVAKDIDRVYDLIELGGYIQVNAGTVAGDLGRKNQRIVKKLLKNNTVHFIGTDSHSERSRAPRMEKSISYIRKKFGEDMVKELFYINPKKIIENKYI